MKTFEFCSRPCTALRISGIPRWGGIPLVGKKLSGRYSFNPRFVEKEGLEPKPEFKSIAIFLCFNRMFLNKLGKKPTETLGH